MFIFFWALLFLLQGMMGADGVGRGGEGLQNQNQNQLDGASSSALS